MSAAATGSFPDSPPPSAKPLAVVFDFGGVIQRRPTTSRAALVAQHLAIPLPVVHDHLKTAEREAKCGRQEEAAFWREFAAAHGGFIASDEVWANTLAAHYLASGVHNDVLAVARALAKQDILTPLCANTVPSRAALNDKRGAYAPFWPRILSCEVGAVKPQHAIFAAVVGQTGLPAHAHLMVDDKPANVAAAQAYGMQGHHFTHLAGLKASLAAMGFALP